LVNEQIAGDCVADMCLEQQLRVLCVIDDRADGIRRPYCW